MRILATVFDGSDRECLRLWLNGASETYEPLCCILECKEPLGWSYPYCPRHLREIFGVCVQPSDVHGMGLFATRDFPRGARVVPFGGELVSQRVLNQRYSADGSPGCTASYSVRANGKLVDALRLRHAWAFSNHIDAPNCKLGSDGISTLRRIRAGKELTVHYGFEFQFQGKITYFIL